MTWGRRNTRAWLDVAHDVQLEVSGEVGPRAVIGNDFATVERLHLFIPFPFLGGEALVKRLEALFEISGVARSHFRQLLLDAPGDAPAVLRVKPIVGVT